MTKAELEAELKSALRSKKIFEGKYRRLCDAYDELEADVEQLSKLLSEEERRKKFEEISRKSKENLARSIDEEDDLDGRLSSCLKLNSSYRGKIANLEDELKKYKS